MADGFQYDVFLSYSSKDKASVRTIAKRLRSDGLRVWFDEWVIRAGDNIPAKIEDGLEYSHVLVLCMSVNAFGSDWARLESGTFRFRDPLNKNRCFIPLRLDDAHIPGSLAQLLYIDWSSDQQEQEYLKLLDACRPQKIQPAAEHDVPQAHCEEKIISLDLTRPIRSVAFNREGTRALSGSEYHTVRLWDVESGHCLRVLEGHTSAVFSVAWSADSRHALSGSGDNTVRLWDVETGRCLRVYEGHIATVYSVAWSADGRRALSGSADNTLRLLDIETGKCLRIFEGHYNDVFSVALSVDGRRALSGSYDRTVRLWDIETGQCLRIFEGHTSIVYSVTWCADGRYALSGSADHTVRLWGVETGRCLRVFEAHTDVVYSVASSAVGRRALSGSRDNTLRLWNVDTGRCLRIFKGHTDTILSVAWSADGRYALSGSRDNTVRLWNVDTGRCLRVFEGHSAYTYSTTWSADGRRALSGSGDNIVRLWDIETGGCLRLFEGHTNTVSGVAWSADGRYVLSGSYDRTVRLWDIETGRCLRVFEGHTGPVFSVAWSTDGRLALSGSYDCTVRIWDIETGQCLRVLEGHDSVVCSVAWSVDGRRALSGSYDNTIRLWNIETGCCLRIFEGHTGRVNSVTWCADGRYAISASTDHTVRLWDSETGSCLRVFEGHTDPVFSVALSADGRYALSGSYDCTVRLWDIETGRCLRVLEGHSATVNSVAWSPDGIKVVSAAFNGVMRIWSVGNLIEESPIDIPKQQGEVIKPNSLYSAGRSKKQPTKSFWRNWSDYPLVVFFVVLAAIFTIIIGMKTIIGWFPGEPTFSPDYSLTQTNTLIQPTQYNPTTIISPVSNESPKWTPTLPPPIPIITPTINYKTNLIPIITDCIQESWTYWFYPIGEQPEIGRIKGRPDCLDLSEYGFSAQINPNNGEYALHINNNIKPNNINEFGYHRYIYYSFKKDDLTTGQNYDGDIELLINIDFLETDDNCTEISGNCSVDLTLGVSAYPTSGNGKFILYRIANSAGEIYVCKLSTFYDYCNNSLDNRIDTLDSLSNLGNPTVKISITGTDLMIFYDKNTKPIYKDYINDENRIFYVGYNISSVGRISAYIHWK